MYEGETPPFVGFISENGVVVDPSGFTIKFEVRKVPSSSAIITKTTNGGGLVTTSSEIIVQLSKSDTMGKQGQYKGQFLMVSSSGVESCSDEFNWTIKSRYVQ